MVAATPEGVIWCVWPGTLQWPASNAIKPRNCPALARSKVCGESECIQTRAARKAGAMQGCHPYPRSRPALDILHSSSCSLRKGKDTAVARLVTVSPPSKPAGYLKSCVFQSSDVPSTYCDTDSACPRYAFESSWEQKNSSKLQRLASSSALCKMTQSSIAQLDCPIPVKLPLSGPLVRATNSLHAPCHRHGPVKLFRTCVQMRP